MPYPLIPSHLSLHQISQPRTFSHKNPLLTPHISELGWRGGGEARRAPSESGPAPTKPNWEWSRGNSGSGLAADGCAVLSAQSCLTLGDTMDYSPPGSSVQGVLQARILEGVAYPFSRGSS